MKKSILTLSVAAGALALAASAQAQGSIWLNNYDSGAGVFQGLSSNVSAPLGTDVEVLVGPTAGSLAAVVTSGGTYNGLSVFTLTDNSGGTGGSFFDANFGATSVAAAGSGFAEVLTWSGASTYALALTTTGAWTGSSGVFAQTVGTTIPAAPSTPTPVSLALPGNIYEVQTTSVPEPTTLALAGLGGLASLVALRRKQA